MKNSKAVKIQNIKKGKFNILKDVNLNLIKGGNTTTNNSDNILYVGLNPSSK